MTNKVCVVVFTKDLRTNDNKVLNWAVENFETVIPLFVFDKKSLNTRISSGNRTSYVCESLEDLRNSIISLGGQLFIRYGDWHAEIMKFAQLVDADALAWSSDPSMDGTIRDKKLQEQCNSSNLESHCINNHSVVEPQSIWPASAMAPREFKVFTPYYNKWLTFDYGTPIESPKKINLNQEIVENVDPGNIEAPQVLTKDGFSPNRIQGGESKERSNLENWIDNYLSEYEQNHNDLPADKTSRISTALHFGTLSAREIIAKIKSKTNSAPFIRQLCWRDFYNQILFYNPNTIEQDYVDRNDIWNNDIETFEKWCNGETGYPIVDAAMKQLLDEGFMHNRARMIVASFLTKDLYISWKQGADYFMKWLSDGDIANNYLNWQWVAGTGTDTNPHRIFNPIRQSERFDPDGMYIKKYLGKLENIEKKDIHFPHHLRDTLEGHNLLGNYPLPIVDHKEAITQYKLARSSNV